jgi:hypothetical protein
MQQPGEMVANSRNWVKLQLQKRMLTLLQDEFASFVQKRNNLKKLSNSRSNSASK